MLTVGSAVALGVRPAERAGCQRLRAAVDAEPPRATNAVLERLGGVAPLAAGVAAAEALGRRETAVEAAPEPPAASTERGRGVGDLREAGAAAHAAGGGRTAAGEATVGHATSDQAATMSAVGTGVKSTLQTSCQARQVSQSPQGAPRRT